MKRFASLFLAAVLGSICTIASFQFFDSDKDGVKLEYINGAPIAKVAYKLDENGQTVPLDFTQIAEQVTPAVVHIRSTQDGPREQQLPEGIDPFG
ncbi:MAG TPA: serine protease, partial [Ohtaekwangia sp.]